MKTKTLTFSICAALSLNANASDCSFKPKTELEEVYCEIEQSKFKRSLVNSYEFRKNAKKTQHLLLAPYAKKLGISMPTKESSKPNHKLNVKRASTTAHINKVSTKPIPENEDSMAACKIAGRHIHCKTGQYTLVRNMPNSKLDIRLLQTDNALSLPAKNDVPFSQMSEVEYLSKTYPLYINKMISIGLGGSTFSFTKYVSTYKRIQKSDKDFSKRFEKMFSYLKKDKLTNGIAKQSTDTSHIAIGDCYFAETQLVICDDIQSNWVFVKG